MSTAIKVRRGASPPKRLLTNDLVAAVLLATTATAAITVTPSPAAATPQVIAGTASGFPGDQVSVTVSLAADGAAQNDLG